jgi:hypothetical protein
VLNNLIQRWCNSVMASRPPDVVIGDPEDPYLLRWWVWKRNKWLNLYLHRVLRSDDDRALHDHPWMNMSYIVEGAYSEVVPARKDGLPTMKRVRRGQGTFKFRLPTALHRLELIDEVAWDGRAWDAVSVPCTTLFLTGPRVRTWGFRCGKGWVKWTDFTQKTPEGAFIAKGCGDIDPKLLAPNPARSGFWPKAPDELPKPTASGTVGGTGAGNGPVNRR